MLSLSTILRCHRQLGWTFRGSSYCRDENKVKRLQWCLQNRSNNFNDVLWTDECSVQAESHRRFCCRKKGEKPRNKPRYINICTYTRTCTCTWTRSNCNLRVSFQNAMLSVCIAFWKETRKLQLMLCNKIDAAIISGLTVRLQQLVDNVQDFFYTGQNIPLKFTSGVESSVLVQQTSAFLMES